MGGVGIGELALNDYKMMERIKTSCHKA